MSDFPFAYNPELTAISMAYKNPRLIADQAMPRFTVERIAYKYTEYDLSEGFTVPDSAVSRLGAVTRVSFTGHEKLGSCEDHALEDAVPHMDVVGAADGQARKQNATREKRMAQRLANLIMLGRELRVSQALFDADNYLTNHKVALSGTSQWSDPTSTPLDDMRQAMDKPILRPNTIVFGRDAFSAFSTHPHVVKAVNGTDGDKGFAKRADIAELFEVDNILIGDAFINSARKGEETALERCWGPHVALYYLDELGGPEENPSFCFTAEFTSCKTWSHFDKSLGMRGGTLVRVGESVDEKVAAPALGYLIQNVAPAAA